MTLSQMVTESDILNASILIVDDQAADVSLLERLLRDARYTGVASTVSPQEVCALYRKNRYDLILLDVMMPEMDGPRRSRRSGRCWKRLRHRSSS